jgi:hypothetical protein
MSLEIDMRCSKKGACTAGMIKPQGPGGTHIYLFLPATATTPYSPDSIITRTHARTTNAEKSLETFRIPVRPKPILPT